VLGCRFSIPPPLVNFSMGTKTSVVFAVARSHNICGIRQSAGSCGLETSLISRFVTPCRNSGQLDILLPDQHADAVFRQLALQSATRGIQQRGIRSVSVKTTPAESFASARHVQRVFRLRILGCRDNGHYCLRDC
jgi:hypothetical protein